MSNENESLPITRSYVTVSITRVSLKIFKSLPPLPCPLSYSLGVGQAQESEFSMKPLRESQQMVTELANTGWNMQKKPDQMLGDSPLPPRDGFMVWVKTIKNTLVFSLVSL